MRTALERTQDSRKKTTATNKAIAPTVETAGAIPDDKVDFYTKLARDQATHSYNDAQKRASVRPYQRQQQGGLDYFRSIQAASENNSAPEKRQSNFASILEFLGIRSR